MKLADLPNDRTCIPKAVALLERFGSTYFADLILAKSAASSQNGGSLEELNDLVALAKERLELELELSGDTQIGLVFDTGSYSDFHKAIVQLASRATRSIRIVDPYFAAEGFYSVAADAAKQVRVEILTNRYLDSLLPAVRKHIAQYSSDIEVREYKGLHDRLIFVDSDEVWLIGASIKDAGQKPSYLIPVHPDLAKLKRDIYDGFWTHADQKT